MDDAPLVCEVIAVADRFKVVVSVDGEAHEVAPLRSETEAAVVCDAVELCQALLAGRPVQAVKLRFQDTQPEIRDALLQQYGLRLLAGGGTKPEPLLAVLQQLADCAASTDATEVWPPDVAAADLLGAAVARGHDAALQALLLVNPSAALAELWMIIAGWAPRSAASLLHLAAKWGNSIATKVLLAAAPSLNAVDSRQGYLPLHLAAESGHTAVVQQLLAAAAEAAVQATLVGWLPLHLAAANGHTAVVRQLLDAAPQAMFAADLDGLLPLHMAAESGHRTVVEQLLDAAPQAALVEAGNGALPLYGAAKFGHTSVVQQLLDAAPQAALVAMPDGRLPLHMAALRGHTAVVQQLLDAAPQAALVATRAGSLPLHLAAQWGRSAVVQQLLDAVPQAASMTAQGSQLPLQLALTQRHGMAAEVLVSAAAAPRHLDMSALLAAGTEWHHLLAVFVSARAPLSDAEWQLIPAPCPRILCALPAALKCSADQARQVVRRLSLCQVARLRAALQWLHVSQRMSGVTLPSDVFLFILFNAVDCDA